MRRVVRGIVAATVAAVMAVPLNAQASHGVFLRLADGPAGSSSAMRQAMPALVERAGMLLLAEHDVATGGCRFSAKVYVVHAPAYAGETPAVHKGPAWIGRAGLPGQGPN